MEFRKEINISKNELKIDYNSKLLLLGSCFIENIGKKLIDSRFRAIVNPFGVLYNPLSICQSLQFLLDQKQFTKDDLFLDKGSFNSLFFHSSFANTDSEIYLNRINESIKKASTQLLDTDVLIITFGTAYVYQDKNSNDIVANCHKLPASNFVRNRLSVDTIVENWSIIIKKLNQNNPNLKVLFTVSPIRHLRDGEHENQLSKSILLLAIDQLSNIFSNTFYFPSYEIVMDDLRDYRFYAEDMVHPNDLTIKYIWEKFSETFFENTTKSILDEWLKIGKSLNHRVLNQDSLEYKQFLKQTLLKLEIFQNKYPYFDCEKDVLLLKSKITQSRQKNS